MRHVNIHSDDPQPGTLADAKFNHGRMLKRAALVDATNSALFPIAYPNVIASPTITRPDAVMMLAVLFGTLGKKGTDSKTLIRACIDMLTPNSDIIGEATGLWKPINNHHPVVVALAIRKLVYGSVFTSVPSCAAHCRPRATASCGSIQDTDRWMKLLQASDRMVFKKDRAGWDRAYANVGADVATVMQDRNEAGYEGDDEDDNEPPIAEMGGAGGDADRKTWTTNRRRRTMIMKLRWKRASKHVWKSQTVAKRRYEIFGPYVQAYTRIVAYSIACFAVARSSGKWYVRYIHNVSPRNLKEAKALAQASRQRRTHSTRSAFRCDPHDDGFSTLGRLSA